MDEATITLKARAHRDISRLEERFAELGFTSVDTEGGTLSLEKVETSDLKGRSHHFYRVQFYPNKLVFTYSLGLNKKKRDLEALSTLMNVIKVAEGLYEVDAGDLHAPLAEVLNEARALVDSDSHATVQQLTELKEKYYSMEKKYKDLLLSSEQNARILLECEKKRDEYYARVKELEGMSDDALMQEMFRCLKTHAGEVSVAQFAKSYGISSARVEEALEYLLQNGYIRKKA
ncbi:Uncharacterised protein [uncultured archaeon]|nr:Uncharacterised protein [uncultured archaeon]